MTNLITHLFFDVMNKLNCKYGVEKSQDIRMVDFASTAESEFLGASNCTFP